MQKDREKNNPSQPVGNDKSRSNGDAVKKRVNDQAQQHRITRVPMCKFIAMCLFAEVEVRRYRVLKKMDDQVTQQHQEGRAFTAQLQAGGKNLYNRRGQHEARTQGDKIFQITTLPTSLDDNRAAKNVCRRRRQAQQNAQQNRMHKYAG